MFEKFSGISLNESDHSYYYKGHKFRRSVTELISIYTQKFDKEHWSQFVSKRDKISQEEVLKNWEARAASSSEKGREFHLFMEELLNNFIKNSDFESKYSNRELKQKGEFFFQKNIENKKITPISLEQPIFDLELDLAGTVDFFGITHKSEYIILDWKTNREIKLKNTYAKMHAPFDSFDDCSFYHYSLQLNIYRYIIEKHCNITIPYLYFVWFHEDNETYKIFNCIDMKTELDIIFKI